jgi:murein DD-endopeptidase MepM/ murein hydrolase activator NlpD
MRFLPLSKHIASIRRNGSSSSITASNKQIRVTVSSLNGSTHFNLHKTLRNILVGFAAAIIAMVVIAVFVVSWLSQEVEQLEKLKEEAVQQYEFSLAHQKTLNEVLEQDNSRLKESLNEKEGELEDIDKVLATLENSMGVKPEEHNLSMADRAFLAAQSYTEKNMMLRLIPSGKPFKVDARVSSHFGYRVHPVTKERTLHKGIDYPLPRGTEVTATADGLVEYAGPVRGYGNLVIIHHAMGFKTRYAHLKQVKVRKGDVVTKGEVVALSGNTGTSTAPHLHYEIEFLQRALNPYAFINWDLKDYDQIFTKESNVPWESLARLVQTQNNLNPTPSLRQAATSPDR